MVEKVFEKVTELGASFEEYPFSLYEREAKMAGYSSVFIAPS